MSTAAQIAANVQNAQASTGPKTPEGKAKVSLNAVKFAFNGRHIILPNEDPADFEALGRRISNEHRPSTPTEDLFVLNMVKALWKEERIEHHLTEAIAANGYDHPQVALLERYRRTARREFHQSLNGLLALRRQTNQQDLQRLRVENQALRISNRGLAAGIQRAIGMPFGDDDETNPISMPPALPNRPPVPAERPGPAR